MKKILYIIMIVFATGMTFTSCTEEEVQPTDRKGGGGGAIVEF